MDPRYETAATSAFIRQIETDRGTSAYWKSLIEAAQRFFDNGADVTETMYRDVCRRLATADAILQGPH